MDAHQPIISIVADDPEVSGVLREIVAAAGFSTVIHASAESFLREYRSNMRGCILLDMQLPGMSGLELQQSPVVKNASIPIIMLTGHASIETAVQAMRAGAFIYLEKPVCPQELQQQVRAAVEFDLQHGQQAVQRLEAIERVAALSEREREVMKLLVDAHTPKRIASRLGISPKTVEFHRANLLTKMRVDSVSELIRYSMSHRLAP